MTMISTIVVTVDHGTIPTYIENADIFQVTDRLELVTTDSEITPGHIMSEASLDIQRRIPAEN
jgi:hypothetical protein